MSVAAAAGNAKSAGKFRLWINQPRNLGILAVAVVIMGVSMIAYSISKREKTASRSIARAAHLAKGEIAQRLDQFEKSRGRLANSNQELQLPPPSDASWQPLSVVEVRSDGSIYFEYPDPSVGYASDPAILWRLRDSKDGKANSCSSRSIAPELLAAQGLNCDSQKVSVMPPVMPAEVAAAAAPPAGPEFMHLDVKRDVVAADHVMAAIGKDDPVALEKLIAEKVSICAVTPEGRLPMAEAARQGHLKALEVLITASCNVQEIEPFSQSTALISAVAIRHPAAVDMLLAAKADPNIAPAGKQLPWQLLGDAEDPLTMQMRTSLRQHGANIDVVDANGATLLIRAVQSNSTDMVRWLIAQRANLDVQDKDGRSAVMHAVLSPTGDALLQLLIAAGANLNLRDRQDYTALGRVMLLTDAKRQKELKQLLTQSGGRG